MTDQPYPDPPRQTLEDLAPESATPAHLAGVGFAMASVRQQSDRHADPARGPEHDVPDRTGTGVGIDPDSHHNALVLPRFGYPGLRPRGLERVH